MTADCTPATTRRITTAVTATPATARADYIQNVALHLATTKLDIGVPMQLKHFPHSPVDRLAKLESQDD